MPIVMAVRKPVNVQGASEAGMPNSAVNAGTAMVKLVEARRLAIEPKAMTSKASQRARSLNVGAASGRAELETIEDKAAWGCEGRFQIISVLMI